MKRILNNPIGMKFGFVLFLFVLLQIPISMVSGLVSERLYRQQEVRDEIARSSSGEQRITGPFLAIDYTETVRHEDKTYQVERQAYILPTTFDMSAHLESFEKYRGIYKARLYKAQSALKGSFDLSALNELAQYQIENISMVVGVKDSRGLVKLEQMKLGGEALDIVPGTDIKRLSQGFHTPLTLDR